MARVFTHQSVDIDAATSVAAWRKFVDPEAEIVFVPANFDGSEMRDGDVALDLNAGGRGIKGHYDGTVVNSCLALIVHDHCTESDKRALAPLVEFVNAQDAHGSAYRHLVPGMDKRVHNILMHCGLNSTLRTLQRIFPNDDRIVVDRMSEIFTGLLAIGRGEVNTESHLDFVASVWAWRRLLKRTATLEEIRTRIAADRRDGHSCFTSLVLKSDTDSMEALMSLMSFVDVSASGDPFRHFLPEATEHALTVISRCGLPEVVRAIEFVANGNEEQFFSRTAEVFDGMWQNGKGRRAAEEEAEKFAHGEVYEGRVVVVRNPRSIPTTITLLEEYRFEAVVFVDGMNLGVVRRGDLATRMDHPKIRAVVEGEEGWFFHLAGFMAARGTRKSPAKTLSRVDPTALVRAVLEVLKEKNPEAVHAA